MNALNKQTDSGEMSRNVATKGHTFPFKRTIISLMLIIIGSAVYIIGMKGILIPKQFLNGGITGISMIIHYLYPKLGLGWLYAVLNIPLFIMGWINVSRRFILLTAFGIVWFSFLTEVAPIPAFPMADPMISAILAGIICGLGLGIIFRSAGSVGGIDILAVYLYKRFSLGLGLTSFLVNALILSLAAIFFNLEMALYTLIFVYTQSKLTDAVIVGFSRREAVFVISDRPNDIAKAIMTDLKRGVTFLEGAGAYSGKHKEVILSIITLTELARLKEIVFNIDPRAFVIVNDTAEVIGVGHGERKIY
ncbi:MAG: YitT family protein [Deltaproteobacteria bacterium]|nr:YitT family protein [Deltaproteobacteria bacterium]